MKIERHDIESMTIEDFADKHGLVMEIHERHLPIGDPARYFAKFKGANVLEHPGILAGVFGNGASPEEAVREYAVKIYLKTLVFDAFSSSRKEINVPRIQVPKLNLSDL